MAKDGIVTGYISILNTTYQLQPIEGEVYALVEVNQDRMFLKECATDGKISKDVAPEQLHKTHSSQRQESCNLGPGNPAIPNIMVLYTPGGPQPKS